MNLPERRPADLGKAQRGAGLAQCRHRLGRGRWRRRCGIGGNLEPVGLDRRQQRGLGQHETVQCQRQRRAKLVTRHLDRLASSRQRAQLIRGFDAVGPVHLGRDPNPQELGLECFAVQHRLPEDQMPDLGALAGQLGGHDGAQPDTQQPAAAVAKARQPGHTAQQIIAPDVPIGIDKLTRTVARAKGIKHQGAGTDAGQRPRLQGHHGPAAVHLLAERRHHQHIAQRRHIRSRGKVPGAKRPFGAGQHKSMRRAGVRGQRGCVGNGQRHAMPCLPRNSRIAGTEFRLPKSSTSI